MCDTLFWSPDGHFKGTIPFAELEKHNTASTKRPYVDFYDDFAMLFTVILKKLVVVPCYNIMQFIFRVAQPDFRNVPRSHIMP